MKCPVCGIDAIVVEHKKIELDHCLKCGGVWFDAGELELLLKSAGASIRTSLADTLHLTPTKSDEKKRRCPICNHKMDKVLVGEETILIDSCPRGHGLWFDGGELQQLIAQVIKEPSGKSEMASFLSDVFQAKDATN
jgi:uncharacterized protein